MILPHNYTGCDISKAMLDLFDPRTSRYWRVRNEREAIDAFVATLDPDSFVVMEATGWHDRALRGALSKAGIRYARLNPRQARRFAEARGRLAKTDRIDARLLAEMGAMFRPDADELPSPQREKLAALARRRDQLVDMRALERRHLADAFDTDVIVDIEATIAVLDIRITTLEAQIADALAEIEGLETDARRLQSAPGVGPVTALTLIVNMPELGRRSPKIIASLAGLAPVNDDSGQRRGQRSIRGGRPRVRMALYMAALAAIRGQTRLANFYTAIAKRSGSKKLAIIAVARKLLTILNAMMRDKTNFA